MQHQDYGRRPDGEPPDRDREAAVEVADLVAFYLPQLEAGTRLHDTFRIAAAAIGQYAETRWGEHWAHPGATHILDSSGVPWCLCEPEPGSMVRDSLDGLCERCLEAVELVAKAWSESYR